MLQSEQCKWFNESLLQLKKRNISEKIRICINYLMKEGDDVHFTDEEPDFQ